MAAQLNAALASGNLEKVKELLPKVNLDDLNKVYTNTISSRTRLNRVRRLAKNKGHPYTAIASVLEKYGALTYNNSRSNIMKNLSKYQRSLKLRENLEPYSPPIVNISALESPTGSPRIYLPDEEPEYVFPYSPGIHPYLMNTSRLNSPRNLPPLHPPPNMTHDLGNKATRGIASKGGKRKTMRHSRKINRSK